LRHTIDSGGDPDSPFALVAVRLIAHRSCCERLSRQVHNRSQRGDHQAHGPYFSMASHSVLPAWYDSREPVATDKTDREKAQRTIADNRKAFHDYHVLDSWEAGVALLGTEVKAIREGSVNLRDSYARLENGEVWLMNVHISPYSHTGYAHHDERRQRKLLLHRHEIQKLMGRVVEKGLTLVPLRMYLNRGRVKVALALVKGKQAHDKRETIRRREVDRETRAAVKSRSR
jgi:SsrA-binding protein